MTRLRRAGFCLVVAAILLFCLFPFSYAMVSSRRPPAELFRPALLPLQWTLANYRAVFAEQPFGRNILNSILVAGSVVALSLLVATLAAYALARLRFRGRGALLAAILAVSMFPPVAILPGMFELIRALGLYNRLPSLTLSYLVFTLPFTIWILTTFMRELPRELEEAALIDGAGAWQTLAFVLAPLIAPAMATAGLLAFIAAWNEYLFALSFIQSPNNYAVPIAITSFVGKSGSAFQQPWGEIMAATIIVTLPLIAAVLVLQKRILAGLTAGAVKG